MRQLIKFFENASLSAGTTYSPTIGAQPGLNRYGIAFQWSGLTGNMSIFAQHSCDSIGWNYVGAIGLETATAQSATMQVPGLFDAGFQNMIPPLVRAVAILPPGSSVQSVTATLCLEA